MYNRMMTVNTLKRKHLATCLLLLFAIPASSCGSRDTDAIGVWAINVGGGPYEARDGTRYVSGGAISGGRKGVLSVVKGTQDGALYTEYLQGDIELALEVSPGLYDITLHFAEPDTVGAGERVFDVYAEGKKVIQDLDVMVFRDGQIHSALTVTAPNVEVTDGELNVRFDASVGEPLLSAMVVRSKQVELNEWRLVWSDEFDEDGEPNTKNWTIEEWPSGVVNSEDQAYTARAKNIRVENGVLVIEAHKEKLGAAEYTSGRMQSSGKRDFLYGRFEVRAKMPRGVGTWAAIWMLPSDPFAYATTCTDRQDWQGSSDCDAWPNSGEIDILEHVGYQMGHVHGTVHNRAYYFINWQQRKGRVLLDDVADEYHVYSMEWSPQRIDVFVDDILYFTYVDEGDGWETWPFDRPFHMIMNLAIGGDWGRAGGPIDDTIFPQRMLVDYVRVFSRQP